MPQISAERRQEQTTKIVTAALECLRENGIAETTMRHIFARAGLSAGAVYNYFPSKIELVEHLALVTLDQWRVVFADLHKRQDLNAETKVEKLIHTMIDGLSDPDTVSSVAGDIGIWAYSIHDQRLQRACRSVFRAVAHGIDCLANGSDPETTPLTEDSSSQVGTQILAQLQGLALQAAMGLSLNIEHSKDMTMLPVKAILREVS